MRRGSRTEGAISVNADFSAHEATNITQNKSSSKRIPFQSGTLQYADHIVPKEINQAKLFGRRFQDQMGCENEIRAENEIWNIK